MGASKLSFLSIDALPYLMLRSFLDRGELPNFQKLEKQGASASGMTAPGPDATTPPAHAALVCGCNALEHGIYSFEEPLIENGVIHPWKKRFGFDSLRLKAEPLWVSFLKAGRTAALLHFPLSVPIEAYTTEARFGRDFSDRLTVIEAFSKRLSPEIVRMSVDSEKTFALKLANSTKFAVPVAAPKAPEPALSPEKTGGLWRMRFPSEISKEPDLYFLSAYSGISSNRPELVPAYLDQVGPFPASAAVYSYLNDKLGPRVYRGGNGKAEERLLSSLEILGEHYYQAIEFVLNRVNPDAGFYYFNGIDLCLHLWMAYLDPSSPAYSQKIYDTLWPVLRKMFLWADRIVGLLLKAAGTDGLVAVVSDHGMAPIESIFYPNQVLADQGYLVWDKKNKQPDLAQSRAVYNGSNSGYIVLNLQSRGGIVPDEEADELARKVASFYQPYMGMVLDKVVLTRGDPALPFLGEVYLAPIYKVTLQEEVEGEILKKDFFGGQHHYWSDRETMKAILYLYGPGVPVGLKLGTRSHLEVAPTIAALAGIEPPDKARMGPIDFK